MHSTVYKEAGLTQIRAFLKTFYYFSPINYEEEKRKFFTRNHYNPQLKYPRLPVDKLKKYVETVDEFNVYDRRVKETKLKLKLLLSRGTENITTSSMALYQVSFDNLYLNHAHKIARGKLKFTAQDNLNSHETATAFRKYLATYGASDWVVKQSKRSDYYFQILPKTRLISIGAETNWDYTDLDSTLAHEIDGHVVREINATNQQKHHHRKNFPFYIKTEEGLACYLGDYHSKKGQLSKKHHAIKYLAGYFALNHSFRQTYEFLRSYGFTKNLAYQRAMRIKRGFTDTALSGCNAREAMYYEGMLEVKDFLHDGGDIRKLFAGKVGLTDLDSIPIPQNQIIPQRLIS